LLLRRLFSRQDPVTAVELAQIVLWCMCLIWFGILALPTRAFELQNYTHLSYKVSEPLWTLVMGALVILPLVVNMVVKSERMRGFFYICISIMRAGIFSFDAAMIYSAVPFGIAAPTHAFMALLALWVVWRLSDEYDS
jgi:predicted membrane protein